MSSSNCCFLTCIQISQEADQVVWYSHLFQNFPQFLVNHTVKGFGIVNKAEVDVFLELSCFFNDSVDVGNLISGSSAFSKSSLKFMVHILLKPDLESVCCSISSSNCCFLTCMQISQESCQVVWYSHLFKNFPQFAVTHTVNSFQVVNEAELDVFLELPCFSMIQQMLANEIKQNTEGSS